MAGTTVFSGNSRFATDFQQIIDRAVAIASLPLAQLNNQKSLALKQSEALTAINDKFTALQASINAVSAAADSNAFSASVSDSKVLKISLGQSTLPGTFSVEVVNIGSRTLTLSNGTLPTVTDPFTESISSASSFTLTVDGTPTVITPADNTLAGLATAINGSGAGVQAAVVNIGSPSAPDYRLSIQGDKFAATTIQLNDGSQDLLQTLSNGTAVQYRVNGQPATPISSDTRTVTVAAGVTAELLAAGTAEITVAKSASNVSNALASFVTAYNAAAAEVDQHRGTGGGALSAESIVFTLGGTLGSLIRYSTDSGDVRSLADLGVTIDKEGKLTFSQSTFNSVSLESVTSFLGAATTAGFLKFGHDSVDGVQNSESGAISLARESVTRQIESQAQLISDNEERIELLRESLFAKMAAADALIAALEQRVTYVTGLFEAIRIGRESVK